jgi:hypothetical protein
MISVEVELRIIIMFTTLHRMISVEVELRIIIMLGD